MDEIIEIDGYKAMLDKERSTEFVAVYCYFDKDGKRICKSIKIGNPQLTINREDKHDNNRSRTYTQIVKRITSNN